MKKIVVLFLISLFIISCVSGPPSNIDSIDKLVKNWAYGLEEKDIDTLMDTYWPEAVFTFIPPEGEEMVVSGIDEIRSVQMGSMEDPTKLIVRVGDVRHISSYTHNNGIEPDFTDGEVLFFSE